MICKDCGQEMWIEEYDDCYNYEYYYYICDNLECETEEGCVSVGISYYSGGDQSEEWIRD